MMNVTIAFLQGGILSEPLWYARSKPVTVNGYTPSGSSVKELSI